MNVVVDIILILGIALVVALATMNTDNVDNLLNPVESDIPDFPPEW